MKKTGFLFIAATFLFFCALISSVHAEDNGKIYEVDADNLTVRKAPDHNAEVVGHLQSGNQVTVFQEKYGWVQTYYAGETAWVASQFLYETGVNNNTDESAEPASDTITITADSAHLRSGPSVVNDVVGFASKDDTYNRIDTDGDWIQVDTGNDTTAWVSAKGTNENGAANDSSNEAPADVTNTSANASESPSTNSGDSSSLTGNSLSGYNIMLDAGHGGKDPGAIGLSGEKEAELSLDITQKVADKLRNEGATVTLTRPTNNFVSLADRMRINDAYLTDAFISLHLNASTSESDNGVSTHFYENGPDKQMAQTIQNALADHTTMNDRGISQDNYHVLRENSADSVLVELGFITNPSDLDILNNSGNADIADGIAEGLSNYLN